MKLKFHEASHRYYLDGVQAKGVTTVAKIGTNTYNLEQYDKRMVAIGMATDPQLVEAVAVNYDDKKKMAELVDRAKQAAKAFAASNRGTTLHQVTERHDLGLDLIETEANVKIRKAWTHALTTAGLDPDPEFVERIIVYPEYRLCGTLDRIFYSVEHGGLVIADAKGGQNAVKYPHAIAVQLALYANAPLLAGKLNRYGITEQFDPMPDVDKTTGYVIWMPEDDKAEVVPIDIRAGWECFNDVILPTLRWQDRDDLVIKIGAAAGSALGEVAPAAAPNTEEETCESLGTTTAADVSGASLTASTTHGSVNPPTTTSETTIKARLRQIQTRQPDLAAVIIARWPIGKRLNEAWTDDETAIVEAFLNKEDPEGPYVDAAEVKRVSLLVAALTPAQTERVTGWVREAARAPGRPLSLGGGWHTTRRVCLAEVCALVAQRWDDQVPYQYYGEPFGGELLAAMNWREAQHLLAITRLHLNLDATITQETNT